MIIEVTNLKWIRLRGGGDRNKKLFLLPPREFIPAVEKDYLRKISILNGSHAIVLMDLIVAVEVFKKAWK